MQLKKSLTIKSYFKAHFYQLRPRCDQSDLLFSKFVLRNIMIVDEQNVFAW